MLQIGFKCNRGVVRKNNEDACFLIPNQDVYIVADGVGGNNSGEIASSTAVESLASFVKAGDIKSLKTPEEIFGFFTEAVDAANSDVYGMNQENLNYRYAPMISKEDGHLDFTLAPEAIERRMRAYDPWPGTFAEMNGKTYKLWRSKALEDSTEAPPGTVLAAGGEGLDISAGGRVLRVTQLQAPGKKRMETGDFLRGNVIEIGTVLR